MVVIRPGDHVWLTAYGERKLEVAIGAQIKKSDGGRKVFNNKYTLKNTKIVIYALQKNTENERSL